MDFQFNEVHARYFRFFVDDELNTNYTINVGGYDPSSDAGKNMVYFMSPVNFCKIIGSNVFTLIVNSLRLFCLFFI